ncbi:MAG: hypothetical protein K8F30_14825 [Taibaiella sp.]|nr:hypothetical protein [Taibaiella sp.]
MLGIQLILLGFSFLYSSRMLVAYTSKVFLRSNSAQDNRNFLMPYDATTGN